MCAALWSLNGPFIKLLNESGQGVGGLAIAFYRSLIGAVVFAPLALRQRQSLAATNWVWPLASVLMFTLMTACFVLATVRTAAASAIILQYTSPVWVFALAPVILHEHHRPRELIFLGVVMVGVAIIFAGGARGGDAAGLVLALLSGFGYGALTVVLRKLRSVSPLVVVALNSGGSALLVGLIATAAGGLGVSAVQLALLLAFGLVQFSLPYALFSWALQRVEARHAALIVLLEAILNPLWTWLAVGEQVPTATLRGGPVILTGVVGWLVWGARGDAATQTEQGRL